MEKSRGAKQTQKRGRAVLPTRAPLFVIFYSISFPFLSSFPSLH